MGPHIQLPNTFKNKVINSLLTLIYNNVSNHISNIQEYLKKLNKY